MSGRYVGILCLIEFVYACHKHPYGSAQKAEDSHRIGMECLY